LAVLLVLSVSVYMVLGPAHWVRKLMQLTQMSFDFKCVLIGLGIIFLAASWAYEKLVSQSLAKLLGQANRRITGSVKKRKQYKVIQESMRV
jgi:cation-transporting P-type ATPase 13A2